MKSNQFDVKGGAMPYSTPEIDLTEIAVEKGYSWSEDNGYMGDDWNDMGDY